MSEPRITSARDAASAPGRAKGPPQDPEAFHRWIEIEKLKLDMRRLEVETRRADAGGLSPAATARSRALIPLTVGLLASLGLLGVTLFQIVQMQAKLDALSTSLHSLDTRLEDRLSTALDARMAELQPPAPAAPANPAAAANAQAPLPSSDPASSPAAATPARPAQLGTGYTVRMFAPTATVSGERIDRFTQILKAAGFEVAVSDTGVAQPTSNSLAYHAGTAQVAEKLATLVQSKRPALDLELRTSPSIPENARQVLILTLTEDALN